MEQEISFAVAFILLIQASVFNKVHEIYSKTLGGRYVFQPGKLNFVCYRCKAENVRIFVLLSSKLLLQITQ